MKSKFVFFIIIISINIFSACENKENKETTSQNTTTCPKYDRSEYKHWVDANGDCQDAREEVFVAENNGTITYLTGSSCKVVNGSWYDPFTNTTFTDASSLDVDHMVPLKEAHESGAYLWSLSKKEEYANDLSSNISLIAVSSSANWSIGSRDPAEWLPTNTSYHNTYASNWASIKVK